jgi:hypothetical protein
VGGGVFGVETAEEIPVSGEVLATSSVCAFHDMFLHRTWRYMGI